jgi:hypothetical protein
LLLLEEFLGEDMNDERGQALTNVRVNSDAETETVFGHELDARRDVGSKMGSGEASNHCFPQVLGGHGDLRKVVAEVVHKNKNRLRGLRGSTPGGICENGRIASDRGEGGFILLGDKLQEMVPSSISPPPGRGGRIIGWRRKVGGESRRGRTVDP